MKANVAVAGSHVTERFGPHCRPARGSFVERLCADARQGRPLLLEDADRIVELEYADGTRFTASRAEVRDRIALFPLVAMTTELPDLSDPLTRRLYSSYLTCVAVAEVKYPLDMKSDDRGALASILRSPRMGQVYVSRTRPGVTRANHYHDRKIEKFLVVEGDALVRLRPVDGHEVTEIRVGGARFEVVDVPPGIVHSIQNVGSTDMVLIFWINEEFDAADLDTHPMDVVQAQ